MNKKLSENILIPKDILTKSSRNHQDKKGWRKVYLYTEHRKIEVGKKLVNEKVIDNVKEIREDTLYKDNSLSKKSEYFDYYKILKDGVTGDIILKKNKNGKKPVFHQGIPLTVVGECGTFKQYQKTNLE